MSIPSPLQQYHFHVILIWWHSPFNTVLISHQGYDNKNLRSVVYVRMLSFYLSAHFWYWHTSAMKGSSRARIKFHFLRKFLYTDSGKQLWYGSFTLLLKRLLSWWIFVILTSNNISVPQSRGLLSLDWDVVLSGCCTSSW
jgi:hypothetical protein